MSETKRRYVRRSPEQWQELIDKQARSGLSQSAFCAGRSLSITSFQHWKRRFKAVPQREEKWLDLGRLGAGSEVAPHWEIELALGEGLCLRLRRC